MYSDGSSDFVVALNAQDGIELWRYKIDATYKGHDGSHDGPMSTPLLVGERVYAVGPRGQLVALDAKTGDNLWSTHLVNDHQAAEPFYGFATSPILDDGVLIVETGGRRSTVAGFDSKNGKQLWSAGNDSVNYHSPVRFRFAGQTQLVCASNNYLYGLEPRRGRVLWSYRHNGRGETINPVVIDQKQIFLRKSWEKTVLLELRREKRRYIAEKVWDKTSLK
jgi:glucose dehydrogenase